MSFFNFNDYLSPNRPPNARSPTSPFCTSPSQLHEVTLDQDATFSNTMGFRSPGGPMRGRSVKEFEEQLASLKKENFSLKLRIYFLEEKMGTNFTLDKDNVVKKNIELQVEIGNLQRELQNKHELLCEAVKAMELEDEEHKKMVASKEEQLNNYQQELEDLRMQLQETKFDSDGVSLKSDTTGFYSSRATNSGNSITELQEKMKILETELQLEKENNASLQIILGQAETLKSRYEAMQKEFQIKEETIKKLNREIEAANEKVHGFNEQMKDLQEKLEISHKENQALHKKMQVESKKFDEIMGQVTELKKKCALSKAELERERKRTDRIKMVNDMKISELEEENEKQKIKIRDLQGKLEAAVLEIKKNQNLAVSKSLVQKSNMSNTDDNSFLVSDPTTPSGTPKKNTLHVQINPQQKSPVPSSPLSPEKFNINEFEQMLLGAGETPSTDQILSQYKLLISENSTLKQKIVKLKSEQMKACEIIKNMIDSRNKATEEICQLKKHIEELEHELESVVSKPTKDGSELALQQRVVSLNITAANPNDENSMAETQHEDLEIAEHYKALTVELEAKIEILVATLNEKDSQMQKIRQQYEEILTNLEDKENRIVDLEFELLSSQRDSNGSDKSFLEKGDTGSEKHSSFYRHEIEEKDKEIERLSDELRKCTCYLQEIVNKELWEKNKEIEKLHNKQANSSEVVKLKKELNTKEMQLKLLKEKISELGLDISIPCDDILEFRDLPSPSKNIEHIKALQDQLKVCKEERDHFKQKLEELECQTDKNADAYERLQSENRSLQLELEKSEKLQHDSNEICSVLSTRLEELAIFLDSLLKQKSVLGFLGVQKNKKLREIIDNSLDLSRSFTMSMMINPDQSLTQLSNITALLNGSVFQDLTLDLVQEEDENQAVLSIVPANVTLTYQSHLYKQNKVSEPNNEHVISALREQIVNLKSELQLRDNELNKINHLNNKIVSDKTTETEDDGLNRTCGGFKDVSKLFSTPSKCNTTSTTLKYQSECQSESEAWSEPDRVVSRARIGLNHTLPSNSKQNQEEINESTEEESGGNLTPSKRWNEKRQTIVELHHQIYTLEDEVKRKTVELINAETKFLDQNRNSKVQLEDLEKKLVETEDKLLKAETKKNEVDGKAKALQEVVDDLTITKRNLEEAMGKKDKETQNRINQLEIEKEQALKKAHDFEIEIEAAKGEIEIAEIKLIELQEEMEKLKLTLRKEYEQYTVVKLKDAEEEFLKKLKKVEEKAEHRIKQMQEDYDRNFLRKSEVHKKLAEVEQLIKELNDLKSMVRSYEETIDTYKRKDSEVKNKLQDYQERINILRKELDNTTLQYSEAVLEKTKLSNEKTLIEQEMSKISVKETEMKHQFNDIQLEFSNVNQNYQHQVNLLQKQRSKLEVKISELESVNAELHNKLVRLQATRCDFNTSMPNIGSKNMHLASFKRQYSDQNYSSEDNVDERYGFNFNRPLIPNVQPVDMERHEANSSPDLGIESDHGRFSSLETHANIPRPLLQTIELTESMSNLLDGENNQVESVTCGSEHCCQKTLEIAHENSDLKRKLLRMRRALEETANQLNLANQRKKQVEKTICKQIHKTSQVLRKAKANLDSGSESDMLNKI